MAFSLYNSNDMDVSLVCPCYNSAAFLTRLLDSYKNQDFKGEMEIIFILDPSKDDTEEILRKEISPSIRLIVNEQRLGVVPCRFMGIEQARGKYVGFVDADDYLEPNFVSKMHGALVKNDADIVNCSFFVKNPTKEFPYPFRGKEGVYSREEGIKKLLMDCSVRGFLWSKMFRKELLLEKPLIMLPKSHSFEDMPYCFSVFAKAKKIATLKDPLYHYSKEGEFSSTSRKNPNRAQEHLDCFALMRAFCELLDDEELREAFLSSKLRNKFTLDYDLSKSKKDGLSKEEASRIGKEFSYIYKKDNKDFSSLSVASIVKESLILD